MNCNLYNIFCPFCAICASSTCTRHIAFTKISRECIPLPLFGSPSPPQLVWFLSSMQRFKTPTWSLEHAKMLLIADTPTSSLHLILLSPTGTNKPCGTAELFTFHHAKSTPLLIYILIILKCVVASGKFSAVQTSCSSSISYQ